MSDLEKLLSEALHAPQACRDEALRALRGERSRPESTGPLLIGMGEAAELLGVSRPTLWRMCKDGKFSKVEVRPGSFRLRRKDIEDFANRKGGVQ